MKPHLTTVAVNNRLTPTMTACLLHLATDEHAGRSTTLSRSFAAAARHLQMRGVVDCSSPQGGQRLWWATKLGLYVAKQIRGELECLRAPDRPTANSGTPPGRSPRGRGA